MKKVEADLELMLRDLRENIVRIRQFARDNKLRVPRELERMEARKETASTHVRET